MADELQTFGLVADDASQTVVKFVSFQKGVRQLL